jgi:hypothetical protein
MPATVPFLRSSLGTYLATTACVISVRKLIAFRSQEEAARRGPFLHLTISLQTFPRRASIHLQLVRLDRACPSDGFIGDEFGEIFRRSSLLRDAGDIDVVNPALDRRSAIVLLLHRCASWRFPPARLRKKNRVSGHVEIGETLLVRSRQIRH